MDASGLFFQNARDDLGFAGSGKIVRILQPEWSQDILSAFDGTDRGIETEREKQEENAAVKDELADMAARMEEAQAFPEGADGHDGGRSRILGGAFRSGWKEHERLLRSRGGGRYFEGTPVFRRTFRHSDFRHAGDRRCGYELFCGA